MKGIGAQYLNQLLNHLPVGVVMVDSQGVILDCSQRAREMLGAEESATLGAPLARFFPEAERENLLRLIACFSSSEPSSPPEVLTRCQTDGGKQFVEMSVAPLRDCADAGGAIVLLQDVTDRINAAAEQQRVVESLRRREEIYRRAIAAANAVPYLKDYATNSYSFMGEGILQMTGYTPEEMTPELWESITSDTVMLGEAAGLSVKEALRKALAGELRYWQSEGRLITRDGRTRWISDCSIEIFDEAGRSTGSIGVLMDITARKQAEAALQYRMEFEQLISSLSGQFINLPVDEVDNGIQNALQAIGKFIGADRSYVFLYRDDGVTMDNTHEWCAEGIEPQIDNLKGLRIGDFPWSMEKIQRLETVHVPYVGKLPSEAGPERVIFEAQSIQSLVLVPLVWKRTAIGFIGFDAVRTARIWSDESVALLRTVAEIIVNALARQQAEKSLRQAEARYHSIFENAVEGIFQSTPDGRFLTANPALARMWGYESPEELLTTITDIERQLYVEATQRAELKRLLEEGNVVWGFEFQVRRKDGSIAWMSENARAVRDESGALLYYEGTVEDITARKQAEAALDLRLQYLQTLYHLTDALNRAETVEAIYEGALNAVQNALRMDRAAILLVDPDGVMRFKAWRGLSDAYRRAVEGHSPWSPEEKNPQPIFLPDVAAETSLGALREVILGEGIRALGFIPLVSQERLLGKFMVYCNTPRQCDTESSQLVQTIARHMAFALERYMAQEGLRETNRRLEEALVELQAAQQQLAQQERLHALGTMASGIAHDFNNALAPILGFSELLILDPQRLEERDRVMGYLQTIHTAAQDAANVISRLREFYRFRDTAEILLPVDLHRLVKQTILLTQPKWKDHAQASGRTIVVQTDLQDVPPAAGNESELREALTNLILNAVDAMPHGGTMTIRTRLGVWEYGSMGETTPTLPHSHTPTQVVLEVSDTGVGMSEEVRRRCLEPFFSTKGEHGSGLGLAVVYGIVQRHNGTIEIDSAPGRGTTVLIRLPAQMEPMSEDRTTRADAGLRSLRVLVVDDEPRVREVVVEYLRRDGHAVETAANGREGLEKFRADKFDLVVTDRAMPEMSGDQLALILKQLDPPVPVILLTGFGEFMNAAGEHPAGVDVVISKPIRLTALREAMAKVIRT